MDLRCLNTFIHVAELSSFTKAGDRLGYSQPTVSFHIKQLEDEVGEKLFDRIGHTVTLTDRGHKILEYALVINRLTDEMLTESKKNESPSGLIRITMADSLCYPLVAERFAEFKRKYPLVALKITTAGTDEMFRMLDHNETDILCTLDNHIYNNTYVISSEEKIGVHFVCSATDPLAGAGEISAEQLVSSSFLLTEKGMSYRRMLDEFFARGSMEVTPELELGSADMLCDLVCDGQGISFLPDYVTSRAVKESKLKRIEVSGLKVELWKQIIYHKDKWVSPQMRAVLDFLSGITIE